MPYPWCKVSPQQLPLQTMTGSSLKLLLYLAALVNEDGRVTIPTSSLRLFFNCSRRQVFRWLNELYQLDLVVRESHGNEVLRLRILRAIRVGKAHPGQDGGSVRDNLAWGDVGSFLPSNNTVPPP